MIVSGDVEPTDQECEWPSDDEEEGLAEEVGEKLKITDAEEGENSKSLLFFYASG